MSSACPKCGATKTQPIRHGIIYKLAWAFGYRPRQGPSCRTHALNADLMMNPLIR